MTDPYRYHPPTVDSMDITPSGDRLGVLIGIYNATDNGTYTRIEVMNRDLEDVITALRKAAAPKPPPGGVSFGFYPTDPTKPRYFV
jgi:hypothetical protein